MRVRCLPKRFMLPISPGNPRTWSPCMCEIWTRSIFWNGIRCLRRETWTPSPASMRDSCPFQMMACAVGRCFNVGVAAPQPKMVSSNCTDLNLNKNGAARLHLNVCLNSVESMLDQQLFDWSRALWLDLNNVHAIRPLPRIDSSIGRDWIQLSFYHGSSR